jgi:hypothetical protein
MGDVLVRLLIVAAAVVAVVGLAAVTRRWQRPSHPVIDITGLDLPSGMVVFTSTECTRCKDTIAVLRGLDVPLREVTWELEPQLIEAAGVTAVPLTVFVSREGEVLDQIVGVPRARRRDAAASRWHATSS